MLSLTIVVLVTAAAGFIVWANDRRHARYGAGLPAGVAVAVARLSWIIFMDGRLGYKPGLTWIPWILPMALGAAGQPSCCHLPRQDPRTPRHRAAHQPTGGLRLLAEPPPVQPALPSVRTTQSGAW